MTVDLLQRVQMVIDNNVIFLKSMNVVFKIIDFVIKKIISDAACVCYLLFMCK